MMTRGLRDQENIRINNILSRVMSLIPDQKSALDDELKGLAMTLDVLSQMSPAELIEHISRLHFDAANTELFADFLILQSQSDAENKNLQEKAKVLYQQIQSESSIYSVAIQNKLQALN
jgi:hypothetical protein